MDVEPWNRPKKRGNRHEPEPWNTKTRQKKALPARKPEPLPQPEPAKSTPPPERMAAQLSPVVDPPSLLAQKTDNSMDEVIRKLDMEPGELKAMSPIPRQPLQAQLSLQPHQLTGVTPNQTADIQKAVGIAFLLMFIVPFFGIFLLAGIGLSIQSALQLHSISGLISSGKEINAEVIGATESRLDSDASHALDVRYASDDGEVKTTSVYVSAASYRRFENAAADNPIQARFIVNPENPEDGMPLQEFYAKRNDMIVELVIGSVITFGILSGLSFVFILWRRSKRKKAKTGWRRDSSYPIPDDDDEDAEARDRLKSYR